MSIRSRIAKLARKRSEEALEPPDGRGWPSRARTYRLTGPNAGAATLMEVHRSFGAGPKGEWPDRASGTLVWRGSMRGSSFAATQARGVRVRVQLRSRQVAWQPGPAEMPAPFSINQAYHIRYEYIGDGKNAGQLFASRQDRFQMPEPGTQKLVEAFREPNRKLQGQAAYSASQFVNADP